MFVTGDKKGYRISKKELPHIWVSIFIWSSSKIEWIQKRFDLKKCIYIGDGFFDYLVMQKVGYSLTPNNSANFTKKNTHHVLRRSGGDRAVAEACLFILKKFFNVKNFSKLNLKSKKMSGSWSI